MSSVCLEISFFSDSSVRIHFGLLRCEKAVGCFGSFLPEVLLLFLVSFMPLKCHRAFQSQKRSVLLYVIAYLWKMDPISLEFGPFDFQYNQYFMLRNNFAYLRNLDSTSLMKKTSCLDSFSFSLLQTKSPA